MDDMRIYCRECGWSFSKRRRAKDSLSCVQCKKNAGNRKRYTLRARDRNPDPTDEELESLIAKQTKRLPGWWLSDTRAMEAAEMYGTSPCVRVVRLGRAARMPRD